MTSAQLCKRLVVAAALLAGPACGRSGGVDAASLIDRCGLDCAADELRFRLAADPRDRALYTALAAVEERRARPGAALAALEAAEQLGRPFRGGVGGDDRARLIRLLLARAEARAARRSPGAEADLARVRDLGGAVPPTLARTASIAAALTDLRHSDRDRRARGLDRLRRHLPGLDALRAGDGAPADVEALADLLDGAGARRALHDLLTAFERRQHLDGFAAMAAPARGLDRWLGAVRWWAGPDARPDLGTLERALAAGADPCVWPAASRGRCDVVHAAADPAPAGPPWEPGLVAAWEQDGVRASGRDQALAWLIVAARAEARGQLASWPRAVRDHVDLAALSGDRTLPAWAKAALAALDDDTRLAELREPAALPAGPRALIERLAAREAAGPEPLPWPRLAATVAAGDQPALIPALVAVADGWLTDAALADRRADDAIAAAVDVAVIAPRLARLFAILGDPARARALAARAFDADPDDPTRAFELALAIAATGDAPAALLAMTRAAAASGDAAATLYRGARGFAAAGETLAALTLARQAIELSAPGDEDAPAGLAMALLAELERADTRAQVAALVALPSAWDLSDPRAAVERELAAAAAPARRAGAVARLVVLAGAPDPARAQLAQAALRRLHAAPRSGLR